jgi:ribosomal protein L9
MRFGELVEDWNKENEVEQEIVPSRKQQQTTRSASNSSNFQTVSDSLRQRQQLQTAWLSLEVLELFGAVEVAESCLSVSGAAQRWAKLGLVWSYLRCYMCLNGEAAEQVKSGLKPVETSEKAVPACRCVLPEATWSCLKLPEAVWGHLELAEAAWSCLKMFGAVWAVWGFSDSF